MLDEQDAFCFQLIRECKDVLYAATLVKQYYQFMVDPVMLDEQEAEEKFASDLDQFDQDLKSMLEVACCYCLFVSMRHFWWCITGICFIFVCFWIELQNSLFKWQAQNSDVMAVLRFPPTPPTPPHRVSLTSHQLYTVTGQCNSITAGLIFVNHV